MGESNKTYIETSSAEHGMVMRNMSQLGGTDFDELEMRILGRTQQLNVGLPSLCLPGC